MTPTAAPLFLAADVGGTRARFLLARWRESEAAPEDREKPPQRAFKRQTPQAQRVFRGTFLPGSRCASGYSKMMPSPISTRRSRLSSPNVPQEPNRNSP